MDPAVAEILFGAFEKRAGIQAPDKNAFLEMLVEAQVPDSSRFSEELPDKPQIITEADLYHCISLRRLLRNRNAKDYKLSGVKKAWETVAAGLGIYSSDVLTRKIRADPELVELMSISDSEFSLLGKIETFDYANPKEILYKKTRPILVIPDLPKAAAVMQWEEANTTYEKEVGLMFRRFKTIGKTEYLA